MNAMTQNPVRQALLDTLLAGLVALVVFGPIVGVVLDGYSFKLSPQRVALLVAVVMAGRLLFSLFLHAPVGQRIMRKFASSDDGVYVREPGYRSRLRWILPLLLIVALAFPFLSSKYLLTVAILGLIYVLLGLGLNIVVGLAGLLDLGYVAFYAIGAYGLALGYNISDWVSGACCRWRRCWQLLLARCLGSRCCACTAIIWRLSRSASVKSFVWC